MGLGPHSGAQNHGDSASTTQGAKGTRIATSISEDAAPIEGEAAIPAEEAELFAARLNLSVLEARRFLALGEQLTAVEVSIRTDQYLAPKFGGFEYDHDVPGVIRASIVETDDDDQTTTVKRRIRQRAPRGDAVAFHPIRHTISSLKQFHSKELSGRNWYALREEFPQLASAWVDVGHNRVFVGVTHGAKEVEDRLSERTDAPGLFNVELVSDEGHEQHVPPNDTDCQYDSRHHCNPLRAGIVLHRPDMPNDPPRCSGGFTSNDSGEHYVITAGHCPEAASDMIRHSNYDVGGYASPLLNGGSVDAVRLRLDIPQWGITAGYYATTSQQNVTVSSVFSGTFLTVGTPLRSSGFAGGSLGGQVLSSSVSAREHTGMLGYSMNTQGGDSGGPIVNANTAIAIHEGLYSNGAMGSWVTNVESGLGTNILTR